MRGHNNNNPSSRLTAKANALNHKIVQSNISSNNNNNNNEGTIVLPKNKDVTGAQDTIYLCNFRVSVDGEWLCLKELQDGVQSQNEGAPQIDEVKSIVANEKCNEKIVERDWVNYYCRCCFLKKKIHIFPHKHSKLIFPYTIIFFCLKNNFKNSNESHTLIFYDLVAYARIIRCIAQKFCSLSYTFLNSKSLLILISFI